MGLGALAAIVNPVALLSTLALGGGEILAERQAYKQQQKIAKIQAGVTERQNQAQRRQEIRRAMIARANIQNTAAQVGTAQTSSAVGAIGSLQSQTANNLATLRSNQLATSRQAMHSQKAASWQADAALLGGIRGMGMDLFKMGMSGTG